MIPYKTIDEYLVQFPQNVKNILEDLRATIKSAAPEATETISYAIPTFQVNKKNLIHFAGYKNHIGVYPAPDGIEAFKEELKEYQTSKGTLQFKLDKPIPLDLIKRIVVYRLKSIKR